MGALERVGIVQKHRKIAGLVDSGFGIVGYRWAVLELVLRQICGKVAARAGTKAQ